MAKSILKFSINLDLLKPQTQSQNLVAKGLHWILSAGRFLIIFVEIIVLAAFLARFKLDADITEVKESIEAQIPYIESLKQDEILIRQTQFQISTIKDIKNNSFDFVQILNQIANQTPLGVTISNLNFEVTTGKVSIKMAGIAQSNNELATFIFGLKTNQNFSEVNLTNVSVEQGLINFSLTASVSINRGVSQL